MKTKIKKIIINHKHELIDELFNCSTCPIMDEMTVTSYQIWKKRHKYNEDKYYLFTYHFKDFFTKWVCKDNPEYKRKNIGFFNFKMLYNNLKKDFKSLKYKLNDIFFLDKNQTFYDYSYTGIVKSKNSYYNNKLVTIEDDIFRFEDEYCGEYKEPLFTFELED